MVVRLATRPGSPARPQTIHSGIQGARKGALPVASLVTGPVRTPPRNTRKLAPIAPIQPGAVWRVSPRGRALKTIRRGLTSSNLALRCRRRPAAERSSKTSEHADMRQAERSPGQRRSKTAWNCIVETSCDEEMHQPTARGAHFRRPMWRKSENQ